MLYLFYSPPQTATFTPPHLPLIPHTQLETEYIYYIYLLYKKQVFNFLYLKTVVGRIYPYIINLAKTIFINTIIFVLTGMPRLVWRLGAMLVQNPKIVFEIFHIDVKEYMLQQLVIADGRIIYVIDYKYYYNGTHDYVIRQVAQRNGEAAAMQFQNEVRTLHSRWHEIPYMAEASYGAQENVPKKHVYINNFIYNDSVYRTASKSAEKANPKYFGKKVILHKYQSALSKESVLLAAEEVNYPIKKSKTFKLNLSNEYTALKTQTKQVELLVQHYKDSAQKHIMIIDEITQLCKKYELKEVEIVILLDYLTPETYKIDMIKDYKEALNK